MPEESVKKEKGENLILASYCTCLLSSLIGLGIVANSCASSSRYNALEKKIDQLKPRQSIENVMGEKEPEKFYEIDGKRVYLEIDGKPVEEYFSKIKE